MAGPQRGIAPRLRQHPAEVQKLSRFQQTVAEITQVGIQVLSVDLPNMDSAAALCRQYGLLVGDALIVAMMQHHGLTHLASLDADFDRVPGLTPCAPA